MEARLGAALEASVAVPEARPTAAVRREAVTTAAATAATERNPAATEAKAATLSTSEDGGGEEAVAEGDVNGVAAPAMDNPEETNVWPTEAEEAAFLSDARGRGEAVVPVARERAEEVEDNAKGLPKLDELVEQIPPETRELLDELFRARFVAVKRVRKADLKK